MGEEKKALKITVDMSKVMPAALMRGEDRGETARLKEMLEEASRYIKSFPWCRGVEAAHLGIGVPGVVAVFLFDIVPSSEEVDDKVWVVVGDVPPAYITAEDSPNPATALDSYIGAMEEWVKAAKAGRSVENLIPVNVAPTAENAGRLESRLRFLDKEILSAYAADLTD